MDDDPHSEFQDFKDGSQKAWEVCKKPNEAEDEGCDLSALKLELFDVTRQEFSALIDIAEAQAGSMDEDVIDAKYQRDVADARVASGDTCKALEDMRKGFDRLNSVL